jgi:hypothetical protein
MRPRDPPFPDHVELTSVAKMRPAVTFRFKAAQAASPMTTSPTTARERRLVGQCQGLLTQGISFRGGHFPFDNFRPVWLDTTATVRLPRRAAAHPVELMPWFDRS